MLKVQGMSGTLQAEGQTLSLKFTERSRVYEEVPATRSDVKVGANVMLDLRVAERKFVAKGIDIMPPGESASGRPGQAGGPPPAEAPQGSPRK
jgi:hypothetical protein